MNRDLGAGKKQTEAQERLLTAGTRYLDSNGRLLEGHQHVPVSSARWISGSELCEYVKDIEKSRFLKHCRGHAFATRLTNERDLPHVILGAAYGP